MTEILAAGAQELFSAASCRSLRQTRWRNFKLFGEASQHASNMRHVQTPTGMNDSLDGQKMVPSSTIKQNQNESQVYLGGQTAWRQSHRHVKLHRCTI